MFGHAAMIHPNTLGLRATGYRPRSGTVIAWIRRSGASESTSSTKAAERMYPSCAYQWIYLRPVNRAGASVALLMYHACAGSTAYAYDSSPDSSSGLKMMLTVPRVARRIASKKERRDLPEAAGALTFSVLNAENGVTRTSE